MPESRAYRPTDRDGWTLKHELAYLAAADRVLLDAIDCLRRAPADAPADASAAFAPNAAALRRRRGEAMHITQELRLDPLRDLLARLGDELAGTIERHPGVLAHPVALGAAPAPLLEHLRAHLARCEDGAARLRHALG